MGTYDDFDDFEHNDGDCDQEISLEDTVDFTFDVEESDCDDTFVPKATTHNISLLEKGLLSSQLAANSTSSTINASLPQLDEE